MAYSQLIRAIQAQSTLYLSHLVRLDFTSGTEYVWTGVGLFRDNKGQVWKGLGELASITDFDRDIVSGQTPTFSLSGVDPAMAARALASSSEIKGRWFTIFEHYFNDTWAPLDDPKAIMVGLMDRATSTVTADKATISIATLTCLHRRRRPALAYLSDATQQTLYPGDRGCSEIPRLVHADEIWPGYNG
jgi:hypothetical protein